MKKYYILILLIISVSFGLGNINNQLLSSEKYVTGEDGVIRMYVNVVGHVKNPGIYLVYDGINIAPGFPFQGTGKFNLSPVVLKNFDSYLIFAPNKDDIKKVTIRKFLLIMFILRFRLI